jgi:hypothetical protein
VPPALTAGLAPVRIPAAHKNDCVPLLPSGPDGVGRFSLRGSWHSTPLPAADRSETTLPQPGIRPRYSGLRVQGTASSPPSTISDKNGGDDRIRTDDPLVANEMLSQLSYIPTLYHQRRPAYFGPAVPSDGGERGIRTLGAETRSTVFETVPFDHSGISPSGTIYNQRPDINSGEPYCLLFIRISPAEAPPDDPGKLLIAA